MICFRRCWTTSWADKTVICPVSCAAPSEVLAIRQENTSQNSVTLLWHEPDQPNGVILEYDIKYYEKVLTLLLHQFSGTALKKNIKKKLKYRSHLFKFCVNTFGLFSKKQLTWNYSGTYES